MGRRLDGDAVSAVRGSTPVGVTGAVGALPRFAGSWRWRWKHLAFALAAALITCGARAGAEGDAVPDAGGLTDDHFVPALDAICAAGTRLGEGCDAIRAREIVDAAAAPWNAVGRVNFASIQVRQHCTGVLLAPRLVLTAAHCLYNYARKVWIPPSSLRFATGYQRGEAVGFAGVQRYILDPVQDTASRDFSGNVAQDWALLILDAPIEGVRYPELAEGVPEGALALAGYPGLRPHVLSVARDCGLPEDAPGFVLLLLRCSAMHGDSGAPLMVETERGLAVAGVFVGVFTNGDEVRSIIIPVRAFEGSLRSALAE